MQYTQSLSSSGVTADRKLTPISSISLLKSQIQLVSGNNALLSIGNMSLKA